MSNIKFRYLYRDGSNYKKWGTVVFSNPEELSIELIRKKLGESVSGDGLFIADQVRIAEVFLTDEYPLNGDDHCFHEFAGVEETSDAPSDTHGRSIGEFVSEVEKEADRGWREFDPRDRSSGRLSVRL